MSRQADLIPVIVERIVDAFHPLRIILFGSVARGEARTNSDIDLFVLLPEVADPRKEALAIEKALADLGVEVDIKASSPQDFERDKLLAGRPARPASREGKIVYDSNYKRYAEDHGIGPTPFDPADNVRMWLRYAYRDLKMAVGVLGMDDDDLLSGAGFHAQQAAEKALKALVVHLDKDPERTHKMEVILAQIDGDWRILTADIDWAAFAPFAVDERYLGDPVKRALEIERDFAEHLVSLAVQVWETVSGDLAEHGIGFDA